MSWIVHERLTASCDAVLGAVASNEMLNSGTVNDERLQREQPNLGCMLDYIGERKSRCFLVDVAGRPAKAKNLVEVDADAGLTKGVRKGAKISKPGSLPAGTRQPRK